MGGDFDGVGDTGASRGGSCYLVIGIDYGPNGDGGGGGAMGPLIGGGAGGGQGSGTSNTNRSITGDIDDRGRVDADIYIGGRALASVQGGKD